MSFNTYLSLAGSTQGLISAGCSSFDSIGNRHQSGHEDEIQVLSLNGAITREQHCTHHPIEFIKPIDKSSPLLLMAVSNNEVLTPVFSIYRLNQFGALEVLYEMKLSKATIIDISPSFPHIVNNQGAMPFEKISLRYESISCQHKIAGTSGYSIWDDRVY